MIIQFYNSEILYWLTGLCYGRNNFRCRLLSGYMISPAILTAAVDMYTSYVHSWKCCAQYFGQHLRPKRKALSKREMSDFQTRSNIVWWPNIFPFGRHLAWSCLIRKFERDVDKHLYKRTKFILSYFQTTVAILVVKIKNSLITLLAL